jgi:hypothetical protein
MDNSLDLFQIYSYEELNASESLLKSPSMTTEEALAFIYQYGSNTFPLYIAKLGEEYFGFY